MSQGQIIPKGKRKYLVRIPLGKDKTGKRLYFNKTISGSKKDAENFKNQKLTEVSTGTFVKAADVKMKEYFQTWLKIMKDSIAVSTYSSYDYYIDHYINPEIGEIKLGNLKPFDIQSLYSSLQPRLAPLSIHFLHRILRGAIKQARALKMLGNNPLEGVKLPKPKRKSITFFTVEETGRFLEFAKNDYYYPLFTFAIITGMRPSEYCGLSWSEVDFENKVINVVKGLIRDSNNGYKYYFSELKSEASRRKLELDDEVFLMLYLIKLEQQNSNIPNPHNLVFLTHHGQPVNRRNLSNYHLKPILNKAGLNPSFRLYDLRHMCATLLLAQGEDIKLISQQLGHTNTEITHNTYIHVMPDRQRKASKKLTSLILRTSSAHQEENEEKIMPVSKAK